MAVEAEALGGGGDPAMPLAHALEINALTLDGASGATLQRDLVMGAGAVRRSRGARPGAGLVRGAGGAGPPCRAAGRRRPHPSDLPLVALSQAEIERLERHYPQI